MGVWEVSARELLPGLTESIWQYEHEYRANIHKVGPVVQVLFMAYVGGRGSISARKTHFICPDSVRVVGIAKKWVGKAQKTFGEINIF